MPAVSLVPKQPVTPLLTVAELKRSPIYTQLQKLIPGGAQADNDAELNRIIMRVSALINGECNQNMAATTNSEIGRVVVSDWGELRLHTRANPIVEVLSVAWGTDPNSLTQLTNLTSLVLDPWRITVPPSAGVSFRPGAHLWAQWSYVSGYPVTTVAEALAAGDESLTVVDSTGIIAGQTDLMIQDGRWFESVTPTAVTGNVLTVPPLMYAHQVGVGVNALPDDIQEAALILISRLHNTWSLAMGAITHDGTGARKNPKAPGIGTRFLCDPGVILDPYVRKW
jgi:hypothetical protein